MLQNLVHHIADAHMRAAEWQERSREARGELSRLDALRLAKGWNTIAKSYRFIEDLEGFLIDTHKRAWFKVEDIPKPPDRS